MKKRLERLEALSQSLGFFPLGSPHHRLLEMDAVAERLDLEDLHVLVDLLEEGLPDDEELALLALVSPNENASDSSSSLDDGLRYLLAESLARGEDRRCEALDNALRIFAELRSSGYPKG